jgi:uncharacterized protein (TIGR02231 family)
MREQKQGQFVQDEFISEADGNRLSEVVVFTDQAYLKRQARVQAQSGLNRFFMEIRAFAVDADSAQARVYGEGEILSVQYKEMPVKEMPQEEVRAFDQKKEQLSRQRKEFENQKAVYEKQRKFLDSMIGFAEIELPKEVRTQFPKTEELKTMLNFLGENYQTLSEKQGELDRQIEELDQEIAVIEKQLKRLRRPKDAMQKGIEILFKSRTEQEIELEVFYVAQHASWQPVYKVDVSQDLLSISLTMFACIQQQTGESWNNVKLAVSNAVPLKGAALPEIESWYVSLPPKQPYMTGALGAQPAMKVRRKRSAKAEELALEDALADVAPAAAPLPEAEFTQAAQTELPLAFEYELPQFISMDSGGGDTILPLYTKALQGEFFVYASPRQDPLVYLVCRASANSELLAGQLNVHFGGRFVGSTALAEKKPGEDLLVNLGVERGVKVRREKVTDKLTETFFGVVDRLSSARELEYCIRTENLKDEAVRVRLIDSIPVSKIDRVQVKGVEIVPEPTQKDYHDHEGVMLWDVQVKPETVQEIRMKFFIKHPKDISPQGL